MTSLLFATREGHLAIVRKLVQCGANVDMKNESLTAYYYNNLNRLSVCIYFMFI